MFPSMTLLLLFFYPPIEAEKVPPPPTEQVKLLITQLGHRDYCTREKATEELKRLGYTSISGCIEAQKSRDLEVAFRARSIVDSYFNIAYSGDNKDAPHCPSIWMLDEKHRFPNGVIIVKDDSMIDPGRGDWMGGLGWCEQMIGYDVSANYYIKARNTYGTSDTWINERIERIAIVRNYRNSLIAGLNRT